MSRSLLEIDGVELGGLPATPTTCDRRQAAPVDLRSPTSMCAVNEKSFLSLGKAPREVRVRRSR